MKTTLSAWTALPLALVLTSGGLRAEDFLVDDDGGPGVDFTDLPAAIDVAADGDVIQVREGTYTAFTSEKGVSVIGLADDVVVEGEIRIRRIESDQWFGMRRLVFDGVRVTDCLGEVFIEGDPDVFMTGWIKVVASADVRIRNVHLWPGYGYGPIHALHVSASHVELVESELSGSAGEWADDGEFAGDGGDGLRLSNGAVVEAALSSLWGGPGGNADGFDCFNPGIPGNGGHGVRVESGCELILSGLASDVVRGGGGGTHLESCPPSGSDGLSILNQGAARVSGVDVNSIVGAGLLEQPAPADAVLQAFHEEGGIRVVFSGPVGGVASLAVGRVPDLPATGTLVKPLMLASPQLRAVGVIGASGEIEKLLDRNVLRVGERWLFLLQGIVISSGQTVRTNTFTVQPSRSERPRLQEF